MAGKPGNGPGAAQPIVAVVEVDGAQDRAHSRGWAMEAKRVTRARAGPRAGRAVEEELEVVEAAALVAVEVADVAAEAVVEDAVAEDAGNESCAQYEMRNNLHQTDPAGGI